MDRDTFVEILRDRTVESGPHVKNRIFSGLCIITKYLPDADINAAEHDIVYSCDVEELISAGITEDDVVRLRQMNWGIDFEFDCLYHFA